MQDLAAPPGGAARRLRSTTAGRSSATDYVPTTSHYRGFLYNNGTMTVVPIRLVAIVNAINDSGQIVGQLGAAAVLPGGFPLLERNHDIH